MKIKQLVNECLAKGLNEGKNVSRLIEERLDDLDFSSVMQMIEEAHNEDLKLPENWGMPDLIGASTEQVMRAFLFEIAVSMSTTGLRLQRIGNAIVFPGQIS